MMETRPNKVSVLEPLGPAIEHMKDVLFRPFDFERWLAIGFCAWLAQLGLGGGNGGGDKGPKTRFNIGNVKHGFEQAWDYVHVNAYWLIPTICIAIAVGFILWIVLTWLSSRGRFMFLYNVVYNTAEVKRPWAMFREYGHSLFLFRLVLDMISGLLVLAVFGGGSFMIISTWTTAGLGALWNLLYLVPLLIILAITIGFIKLFTNDFIVPIMIKRTTFCVPAWKEFRALLDHNKGRFILYAFFKGMINVVVGILILVLGLMTCCCGIILLVIPFVGTVLLLPLHVFDRAYSLHYLRQYGQAYDLLVTAPRAENQPGL